MTREVVTLVSLRKPHSLNGIVLEKKSYVVHRDNEQTKKLSPELHYEHYE